MSKRARTGWVALAILICAGLALSGTSFARQSPAPQQPKKEGAASQAAKPEEAKKPEGPKPGEDKTFDDVVKEMEVKKGLFTFYYKADENKLLIEIQPEQLDKIFLFAGTLEQATGERGLYAAQMGDSFPIVFRRVGKTVQWVEKNTTFTAAPGTPAARYTARSFADAILGSAKIQSKPHPERKSILLDAAELFVSDLPGFAIYFNRVYQPSTYHFDKGNSAAGAVKVFPENVLLDVWLHYATDNPRTPSVTLPDERSIPIVVKYELSTLRETGYKPRLADDRVGQFLTIHQDFTSDQPKVPYTRYIHRWQLEKADPTAKLSPPKQPIVFWLENTIPVEYREWFKDGVLLWNRAFERAGFKDAIVVKQMPDDADWDPDVCHRAVARQPVYGPDLRRGHRLQRRHHPLHPTPGRRRGRPGRADRPGRGAIAPALGTQCPLPVQLRRRAGAAGGVCDGPAGRPRNELAGSGAKADARVHH